MVRMIAALMLAGSFLVQGCKLMRQHTALDPHLSALDTLQNPYLAQDRVHLLSVIMTEDANCTNLNVAKEWTPEAMMGRLYENGMEKPPSPRAESGHQSIQSGGYKALRRAFYTGRD